MTCETELRDLRDEIRSKLSAIRYGPAKNLSLALAPMRFTFEELLEKASQARYQIHQDGCDAREARRLARARALAQL